MKKINRKVYSSVKLTTAFLRKYVNTFCNWERYINNEAFARWQHDSSDSWLFNGK